MYSLQRIISISKTLLHKIGNSAKWEPMMKRGLVAESQIKYSLLNIFLSTMYQDNKTQMQYLNLILEIECA